MRITDSVLTEPIPAHWSDHPRGVHQHPIFASLTACHSTKTGSWFSIFPFFFLLLFSQANMGGGRVGGEGGRGGEGGGEGGGGGGSTDHSPPAQIVFFFFFLFLLRWREARAYKLHFFRTKGQSTVGQRAERSGRAFPDALRVNSFPWWVPTLCWTPRQPAPIHWVKGVCVLSCYCHLHCWELVCANAAVQGWNW